MTPPRDVDRGDSPIKLRLGLTCVLFMASLAACAPLQPPWWDVQSVHRVPRDAAVHEEDLKWRTSESLTDAQARVPGAFEPAVLDQEQQVRMGIIEFDDFGALREKRQLTDLADYLQKRKPDDGPLTLLLFTHGWQHNANPYDRNLVEFRRMLLDTRTKVTKESKVLGVYLAWPGNIAAVQAGRAPWVETLQLPYTLLSFSSRMNGAERVGRLACTEAMLTLITEARTVRRAEGPDGVERDRKRNDVRTIVIGHSFGGLVVERAFLQAMLGYRIINSPMQDELDFAEATRKAALETYVRQANALDCTRAEQICVNDDAANKKHDTAQKLKDAQEAARNAAQDEETKLGVLKDRWVDTTSALRRVLDGVEGMKESWLIRLGKKILGSAEDKMRTALDSFSAELRHVLEMTVGDELEKLLEIPKTTLTPGAPPHASDFLLQRQIRQRIAQIEMMASEKQKKELADLLTLPATSPVPERGPVEMLKWEDHLLNLQHAYEEKKLAKTKLAHALELQNVANMLDEMAKKLLDETTNALAATEKQLAENKDLQKKTVRLEQTFNLLREDPVADVVLLANPASEALVVQEFQDVWEEGRIGARRLPIDVKEAQRSPLLITISAKADKATKWAFPVGTFLTRRGSDGRKAIAKGRLIRHTAPQLDGMVTHYMDLVGDEPNRRLELTKREVKEGDDWRPPNQPRLWVVRASNELIRNHGDVFRDDFSDMIVKLLVETKKQQFWPEKNVLVDDAQPSPAGSPDL